jgi:hypothetical protein
MSWILWGGSSEEPLSPKPYDPEQRKKGSPFPTANSDTVPDLDTLDADGDEGDSELEWDSWPRDLARQAHSSMDKHITVIVPEPSSTPDPHLHGRFGIARSTSNMSLSAQLAPISPAARHEILSSANMDLLSVNSPALLTAPSVLPLQSSGVTTSTVSVGGIVRARSLMSVDGGRRRGVARAIEIPTDNGGKLPSSPGKRRAGKQKRTREEHSLNASATPSTGSMRSTTFSPTSTVRSTVSVQEESGAGQELASMSTTSAATTSAATLQPVSRHSNAAAETQHPATVAGENKAGKGKGLKSPSRGLAFSAERLVSKIESGWIS